MLGRQVNIRHFPFSAGVEAGRAGTVSAAILAIAPGAGAHYTV